MSDHALLEVERLRLVAGAPPAERPILLELDLRVEEREILAVVGASGSGKTLLGLALLGLLPNGVHLTGGRIRFQGRDLVQGNTPAFAEVRGWGITWLPQDPRLSLHPGLRIGAQVADVLARHARLQRRAAAGEALRWLDRVGFSAPDRIARAWPHELSGGMAQRVALARALACSPRLLIADEPTSALDVVAQAQVLALLRDLTRDLGVAVLLITHDLAVAAGTARRIAVIAEGRVVEEASPAQLTTAPVTHTARALLDAARAAALPPTREDR